MLTMMTNADRAAEFLEKKGQKSTLQKRDSENGFYFLNKGRKCSGSMLLVGWFWLVGAKFVELRGRGLP
jgi:hypothetical protein